MVDFRMGNTHKQESLLSHLNLIDFLQASKSFQSIVPVQIREKNQMEFAPMYSWNIIFFECQVGTQMKSCCASMVMLFYKESPLNSHKQ